MTPGDTFLTDALKKMDANSSTKRAAAIVLAAVNRFRKIPLDISPPR